jgi:uncharacterized protein
MDPIIDYRAAKPASLVVSKFMSQVYGWMTFGLLITAVVSYVIGNDQELLFSLRKMMMPLFILQFGLVIGLSWGINKISVGVATFMFLLYSFVTGVFLSPIFAMYSISSLGQTFAVTAGSFGVLALYGATTKKDLNAMGTFMLMGLFGIIIASLVNFFFRSEGLSLVVSFLGVIIFAGLTAWDSQKIKNFANSGQTQTEMGQKFAIMGALTLYLDFINLFLFLLRFMGGRGGSRRDY